MSSAARKRQAPFRPPRPVATATATATATGTRTATRTASMPGARSSNRRQGQGASVTRTRSAAAAPSKGRRSYRNANARVEDRDEAREAGGIPEVDLLSDGDNNHDHDHDHDQAELAGARRSRPLPAVPTITLDDSSPEPEYMLAELVEEAPAAPARSASATLAASQPEIPPKLLTRLLYHHFEDGRTKVHRDANMLVAKYVDIFVREAVARAAYEKARGRAAASAGSAGLAGSARAAGLRGGVDGYLEVEDLEKAAPQLVLDF